MLMGGLQLYPCITVLQEVENSLWRLLEPLVDETKLCSFSTGGMP